MMSRKEKLFSKREKVHYGDYAIIDGKPVAKIKAGKKYDYVTAEEFAEDLYGVPVTITPQKYILRTNIRMSL